MLNSICICQTGKVRASNQDRAGHFSKGNCGLYVVADGMGGHYAGEKASETVLSDLRQWWDRFLNASQRPGFLQGIEQLKRVIEQCHQKISSLAPPGQICGTTLVLLWILHSDYALFSVGDSRCYQISRQWRFPSKVVQLTQDDVANPNGFHGPQNEGKLLRALGAGRKCSFSLQTGLVQPHTVFALCSDGVYKECPKRVWERVLKQSILGAGLEKMGSEIIQEVERNGARDNYSLILVSVC